MQLFVLQFSPTDKFHTTAYVALELQWHICKICKNTESYWYSSRMSPVRSGATELEIQGTQLPPPRAAPAAPTAFEYGTPVKRKGSLEGFQHTPNPHNPHAFPKMSLLLLQCFQLCCESSGSPAGGETTLCCIHPAPSHAD